MNLCFICDNNFVVTTKAAINSLVQTQTEDLKIYVIGIELSDESAGQFAQFSSPNVVIEVIRQDNLFSHIKHTHPNISTAVFFKFMIAKLLKEDKVLYLDGDVIVTDNIADFYSTNLENYYAAVVSDLVIEKEKNEPEKLNNGHHFNAGVMLLNLQKIRQDNLYDKLYDRLLKKKNFKSMDQDIFNAVFGKEVIFSDLKWNYLNVYETKNYEELKYVTEKNIIHYAGYKPWNSAQCPLSDKWLKYVLPEDFGLVLKAYFNQYENRLDSQKNEILHEYENLKTAFENQQRVLESAQDKLAEIQMQNAMLTQRLENLEKRPHFVWRLYEFIRHREKTTLYVFGMPVFKIKQQKVYLFGIPVWKVKGSK